VSLLEYSVSHVGSNLEKSLCLFFYVNDLLLSISKSHFVFGAQNGDCCAGTWSC
jgi:hypothetical protein